jgi:hypothetical protein
LDTQKINPKKIVSFWTWWQHSTIFNRLYNEMVAKLTLELQIYIWINIDSCHWWIIKNNLSLYACHKFFAMFLGCIQIVYYQFWNVFHFLLSIILAFGTQDVKKLCVKDNPNFFLFFRWWISLIGRELKKFKTHLADSSNETYPPIHIVEWYKYGGIIH